MSLRSPESNVIGRQLCHLHIFVEHRSPSRRRGRSKIFVAGGDGGGEEESTVGGSGWRRRTERAESDQRKRQCCPDQGKDRLLGLRHDAPHPIAQIV